MNVGFGGMGSGDIVRLAGTKNVFRRRGKCPTGVPAGGGSRHAVREGRPAVIGSMGVVVTVVVIVGAVVAVVVGMF